MAASEYDWNKAEEWFVMDYKSRTINLIIAQNDNYKKSQYWWNVKQFLKLKGTFTSLQIICK